MVIKRVTVRKWHVIIGEQRCLTEWKAGGREILFDSWEVGRKEAKTRLNKGCNGKCREFSARLQQLEFYNKTVCHPYLYQWYLWWLQVPDSACVSVFVVICILQEFRICWCSSPDHTVSLSAFSWDLSSQRQVIVWLFIKKQNTTTFFF